MADLTLALNCSLGEGDTSICRKGVLGSSLAETGEPGVRDRVVQHIDSMLVEGIVWPKQGHHVEQSELVLV